VVDSCTDEPCSFDLPPFSLRNQPQRPGELAELLDIAVDADVVARVRDDAAAAGLPLELALYIAVEAERALDEAVNVVDVTRVELVEFLDAAACAVPERAPRHLLARPLEEYALGVVRGLTCDDTAAAVRVRVPHRVACSWAHAAAAAGMQFDRWLAEAVNSANPDRAVWEAAAARTGRTLAEWVFLQAARCARSRSTSPQTAASG
jgi:hypothetical protein